MFKKVIKAVLNLLKKKVLTKTSVADQLPVDKDTVKIISWLMDPNHLKMLGVILAGGFAIFALIRSAWEKYTYRSALAREMKKQLEPMYEKLEDLEEQNKELKSQNDELLKHLKKQEQW